MPYPGNHIGTLIKPHGYKGEMLLKGKAELLKDLREGNALFIDISGQRIPFFIEEFSAEPSLDRGIIKFEFIDSNTEARKYSGCELWSGIKPGQKGNKVLSVNEYIGFTVIDKDTGISYTVTDYYESEANPVLLLEYGKKEVMLPLNADYVLSVDVSKKTIEAAFPEGLVTD